MNNSPLLTRTECSALRALAIAGIVLHNYCHWLPGIIRENEYQMKQQNVDALLGVLAAPDANLPLHLLSFFGHYGVPVFLFLSAYGLVMKYEQTTADVPEAADFVWRHFKKLFKMMIVGFVAFVIVDNMTPRAHHYHLTDVVGQLLMFNNLLPQPDHVIWPGPFWFFGLMLQFYIVYRLLLCRRHWGLTVALMVLCVGIQLTLQPDGDAMNRYRYNFMGGMLPFGAGLLYARYGKAQSTLRHALWFAVSVAVVVIGSVGDRLTWALVPLFVVAAHVALIKLVPDGACQAVARFGLLSAPLFVMHPAARKIVFSAYARSDVYAGLLLYLTLSIALAWACHEILKKI